MTRIIARLPQELVEELDRAARILGRSRSHLIRQAIEHYLEALVDLARGLDAHRNPADPVLDWEDVRVELLAEPTGEDVLERP